MFLYIMQGILVGLLRLILSYLQINPYLCGEIFCVDACMYYIDATISHADASFF